MNLNQTKWEPHNKSLFNFLSFTFYENMINDNVRKQYDLSWERIDERCATNKKFGLLKEDNE